MSIEVFVPATAVHVIETKCQSNSPKVKQSITDKVFSNPRLCHSAFTLRDLKNSYLPQYAALFSLA